MSTSTTAAWDEGEARIDRIGSNGPTGEHYVERDPYTVTTLMVAVHPAETAWLGSDSTVVVEIKDEGGGPWLELHSWDGPAVIESLAMLEAVADTARRLLAEAEAGEGGA